MTRTKPKKVKDLSKQRFGRLLVLSYVDNDKFRSARWKCKCDCGEETIVSRSRLISGNTTSCGCYNREIVSLPYGEAASNKIFGIYKQNANRRNLSFDVPKDRFLSLIKLNCFYCGKPPFKYYKIKNGNGGTFYTGIDRVNNNEGYTLDNVVPCCETCNYAKREMSYGEFKSWIFDLADNMISKEILHNS